MQARPSRSLPWESGRRLARATRRRARATAWRSTGRSARTPRRCGATARGSILRNDLETRLDPVRALADDAIQAHVVHRGAQANSEGESGAEVAHAHEHRVLLAIRVASRQVERGNRR